MPWQREIHSTVLSRQTALAASHQAIDCNQSARLMQEHAVLRDNFSDNTKASISVQSALSLAALKYEFPEVMDTMETL